jgi:hypothetical protein
MLAPRFDRFSVKARRNSDAAEKSQAHLDFSLVENESAPLSNVGK